MDPEGPPFNVVRGDVLGNAVQAGQIHGGVHIHGSAARHPDGPVVVGLIPQRPLAFQPRAALRDQYDVAGRTVAFTGMRGIGKTQIAAAIARACIEDEWPVVAWIAASAPEEVAAGFAELAMALGLREDDDDAAAAAERARRWAQTASRCLLVLDDAADPDLVRPWLPAAGATVVITSTRHGFDDLATVIEVGVFTDEESLSLLGARTTLDDPSNARSLAEEVGHLPLALAQSAAVIRRQRLTYPEFLHRLRMLPVQDYLSRRSGDPYPVGAAAAILLSFASVERDDPRATALIEVLALLSPAGVARELVRGMGTPAEIDDLLGLLAEASLLSFGIDGATVIMHRFVQRVARDRARMSERLAAAASSAARLLIDTLEAQAHSVRAVEELDGLGRQISALWTAVAQDVTGDWPAATDLLKLRAGELTLLVSISEVGKALELGGTTYADSRRILGPEHPETLRVRNNLAGAHSAAGDHDRASALFQRNLRVQTATLGALHPETMATRNNLAYMHLNAGRSQRAVRMLEEVLSDRTERLGPDHPDTLLSLCNLGVAYGRTGRLPEAVEKLEDALRERQRVLGRDHAEIITTLRALEEVHNRAGHLDEAVALREEILTRYERVFGAAHPQTVIARSLLADAYVAAGRQDRAIRTLERNLNAIGKEYGPDAVITQIARRNLDAARRDP